jgi:hypothetical protein
MDDPIYKESIWQYNYDKIYLCEKYPHYKDIYISIEDTYMSYGLNENDKFITRGNNARKHMYMNIEFSEKLNEDGSIYEILTTIGCTFPNLEKLFHALEQSESRYYVETIIISSNVYGSSTHAVLLLFDNEMKTISLIDPNNELGFYNQICGLFKNLFSDTWYTFLSSCEMDILKKNVNHEYNGTGHCGYYTMLFSELFLSSNKDPERVLLPLTQLDTNSRNTYIYKYAWHLYKNFKKYEERVVKEKQEKLKKSQEYYREYAKTVDIYANLETFLNHTIPA